MGLLKKEQRVREENVREEIIDGLLRDVAELQATVHAQAAWIDALTNEAFDRRALHNGSPRRLCAERGCGECRGATGVGPRPRSPIAPPKPFTLHEPPHQECCGHNPTLYACLKNKCAKALNADDRHDYESWEKRYISANRQVLRDHPEAQATMERRIDELRAAKWIP